MNKTKVCKVCGEEKPIDEFLSKTKLCRICNYLNKNNPPIIEEWSLEEYKTILDSVLNKRIEVINEVLDRLNNKTLDDIITLLSSELKIKTIPYSIQTECNECGKELRMTLFKYNRNKRHFCCAKCKGSYSSKHKEEYSSNYEKRKNRIKKNCKICEKEFEMIASAGKSYSTCSKKCSLIYQDMLRQKRAEKSRLTKTCSYCGKEYEVIKSQDKKYNSKFCCKKCKDEWQKTEDNYGTNNPAFKQKEIKCDWCGELFYVKLSKIKLNRNLFCSNKCRQEWYSKVYSQTDEWKEKSRLRAIEILESGAISRTESVPQVKLNKYLKDMQINNKNEYNCKYYSIDNFLIDYNLMIECNGTFWHADNRLYKKIDYVQQLKRIRSDKSKNTYIKNKYNIEILYLWEEDIINSPLLCKSLINLYIENKGILKNYHSFNYILKEDSLHLKNNSITPFMEWKFKDLNKIIDLETKENASRKQKDKWITFNCERCGKETEQLISRYNKRKRHFCSKKCTA